MVGATLAVALVIMAETILVVGATLTLAVALVLLVVAIAKVALVIRASRQGAPRGKLWKQAGS
jgi:hypothetical protein